MDPRDEPGEYEQLVALTIRVDQVLRELESWLHVRERTAARDGARARQRDWRRRRLAILRHSQTLLTELLRRVDL
jgi:hypothetical protein